MYFFFAQLMQFSLFLQTLSQTFSIFITGQVILKGPLPVSVKLLCQISLKIRVKPRLLELWKETKNSSSQREIRAIAVNSVKSLIEGIACVASVSARFRSKERETRVKDRGASKRAGGGGGWGRKEGNASVSPPLPPLSFVGSRLISRAIKTETPLPRSLFAPKPNGNAC